VTRSWGRFYLWDNHNYACVRDLEELGRDLAAGAGGRAAAVPEGRLGTATRVAGAGDDAPRLAPAD
jgi:hypothetical protein